MEINPIAPDLYSLVADTAHGPEATKHGDVDVESLV